MEAIFAPENRLRQMLRVEAALAGAQAGLGIIPKRAADEIEKKATLEHVKPEEVARLREEKGHGIAAMVELLTAACGESGRYVHLGATSNDISDTALALQMKEGIALLKSKLDGLFTETHLAALKRCEERIKECERRVLVGKLSGAVGTHAAFGKKGLELEAEVMRILGLGAAGPSNQLVQRDRHAELVLCLSILAGVLEGIALDTDSKDVLESARLARSKAACALENVAVEHEGELTTLPFELVVIPELFIKSHKMLKELEKVLTEP